MMVYIDLPPHTRGWSHLFADSVEELHAFAAKVGIKRCWFENKRGRYQPHYDVRSGRLNEMIHAGAELVHFRKVPEMLKDRYYPKHAV
ncbi:MAG: DUF4031 domain-containing protein [Chryseolinea sp.]